MSDDIRGFITNYKNFLGTKEELRVNNMSGAGLIAIMTSNPDEPDNEEYI